jgi:hypothetical protein
MEWRMANDLRDAFYYVKFGAGALFGCGGLVIRSGKIGGLGNQNGTYSGSVSCDADTRHVTLDIGVHVGPAEPIASGLKAGPAGSTIYFKAHGAVADPQTTFPIDLAGHKCEMSLTLVEALQVSVDDGVPASRHPDAFPDGIYKMESAGASYLTRTVVVFNSGQLLGAGEMGGQYRGTYTFDPIRKLTIFTGTATLPPGVPLVTGGAVGQQWLTAPLTSEAKFNNGKTRLSFGFGGRAIDAALTYVQPLPA